MYRLLLVDPDGRRRLRLEVAVQRAGHRAFNAGSVAEALNMAAVYVPDAILVAADLEDGNVADLVRGLRAAGRPLLADVPVVTPEPGPQGDPHVCRASGPRPAQMLAAAEEALAEA
jgi:DNA-binding response OmpR family regulator